jgi:DNA replication protein DnaC
VRICVAKPFCKIYSGEIKTKESTCSPKRFLDKALTLAFIPPEFIRANLYNSKVDKENIDSMKRLKVIVENIVETVDSGRNFFIYGDGVGTGKTYMACVILNHFIYKTCQTERFDYENPLALFCDYSELMDNLRYSNDEVIQIEFERIKRVPLLLLDDLGAGTVSDFVREQTFLIVNYRYNHKLSTMITSNFQLEQLRELLGERIMSRLSRDSNVFFAKGSDRR